jgi:hypothetical protein
MNSSRECPEFLRDDSEKLRGEELTNNTSGSPRSESLHLRSRRSPWFQVHGKILKYLQDGVEYSVVPRLGGEFSSFTMPFLTDKFARLRSGSLLEYVAPKSPVPSGQDPDIAPIAPSKPHLPSHGGPYPRESSTRQARGASGNQTRE